MKPLSLSMRRSLERATSIFEAAFAGSPAEEYVAQVRAIAPHIARDFRIGYVNEEVPGFERFVGRCAIPNVCAAGHVVGVKFRDLTGADKHKYDQPTGQVARLYNLRALNIPSEIICITEGEMDTIALTHFSIPSLGVPGASSWRPRHAMLLEGYEKVVVVADADKAGRELARTIAGSDLPVSIIEPPGGCKDANEALVNGFGDELREAILEGGEE